eukprot:82120-Chlamydomonas_euryale.AAC.1
MPGALASTSAPPPPPPLAPPTSGSGSSSNTGSASSMTTSADTLSAVAAAVVAAAAAAAAGAAPAAAALRPAPPSSCDCRALPPATLLADSPADSGMPGIGSGPCPAATGSPGAHGMPLGSLLLSTSSVTSYVYVWVGRVWGRGAGSVELVTGVGIVACVCGAGGSSVGVRWCAPQRRRRCGQPWELLFEAQPAVA